MQKYRWTMTTVGKLFAKIYIRIAGARFPGSRSYWRSRYARGGTSGTGSYGDSAQYKAKVLNGFVQRNGVESVIEFGCGDGNQLSPAQYPSYIGFDISPHAVTMCRERFQGVLSKQFRLMEDYAGETADLALSLDVVYHLVEDEVFEGYMRQLFAASARFVIINSSNTDTQAEIQLPHIRHREHTAWVSKNLADWRLAERIRDGDPDETVVDHLASFFVYERPCDTA
jgi:SAM-dependent methyltransferase